MMILPKSMVGWRVLLAVGALGVAGSAAAAEAVGVEEIIVTAQRRAESVQETPLAISALTGQSLRDRGITDIYALSSATPNVNISQNHGVARINIRGIGHNASTPISESNIAFHVDGVYITRPEAQGDVFFDVERIEVVRGPQGTLYGRNATGGAINVITRDPTDTFTGSGQITLGNYQTVLTEGAVSGPIAPGISARIAFQTSNRDGYAKQGIGGTVRDLDDLNTRAIRAKVKVELGEVTAIFSGQYFHKDDADGLMRYVRTDTNGFPPLIRALGGFVPEDTRNSTGDYPASVLKSNYLLSSTIRWSASPALNLTSVTGYLNTDSFTTTDFDYTNIKGTQQNVSGESDAFSQELRADGKIGRLTYVAGAYYLKSNLTYTSSTSRNNAQFTAGALNAVTRGTYTYGLLESESWAAFAQASYDVTDQFAIDVGIRYTTETQVKTDELRGEDRVTLLDPASPPDVFFRPPTFLTNVPYAKVTFNKWTPKFTARFKPTEDIMMYATYGVGFKSGGFNIGTGQVAATATAPEILKDIEGGIKSEWFDRRLQINLSVFHYKYTNLQIQTVNPTGGQRVENAGKSRLQGAELAIIAVPTDNLRLNLEVGYNDSKYIVYSSLDSTRPNLGIVNVAGNDLLQAPRYQISTGAEYSWPVWKGRLTLRGEAKFIAKTYFNPFNTETYSQNAYELFDAYLTYKQEDGKLTVGLYGKNLADKNILSYVSQPATGALGVAQGNWLPPRTYGVRLGYNF